MPYYSGLLPICHAAATIRAAVHNHTVQGVRMSDKLTMGQAVQASGKSESTIRRLIREGKLTDSRRDKREPLQIDRSELMAVFAAGAIPVEPVQRGQDRTQELIDELRRDKDRLLADNAALRQDNADLKAKVSSLERELNRGVRGLLNAWRGR